LAGGGIDGGGGIGRRRDKKGIARKEQRSHGCTVHARELESLRARIPGEDRRT